MEYRNFGNSDLKVSVIGFGCWPMGGSQYGTTDDNEEVAAVHKALDAGITCFDTAAAYGPGHSEEVLGKALGARRKDVVVVTKCGIAFNPETETFGRDSSREHILSAIDRSLALLDTDYLDLYLIHWPDPKTPISESMGALQELIDAGKIRYAGVSNFQPDLLTESRKTLNIVANQVGYHMFDRRIERELIPHCEREGIGIMAYGSLAHGVLTGAMSADTEFEEDDWRATGYAFGLPLFHGDHFIKNLETVDRLSQIADRLGVALPTLASAWVLRDPTVTVSLIGFRRPEEIDDALKVAELQLSDEVLEEIDAISTEAFERLYADGDFDPIDSPPNPDNPNPTRR